MKPTRNTILFAVVVTVCLAEVGWWCYFMFQENTRLEQVGRLLALERVEEARLLLGAEDVEQVAERARRRRMMFASEGAVLGLLGLMGVILFYTAWLRERRLRATQDRFLAGVTHELKTPLATVRLALESLMERRVPDDRRAEYEDTIMRELARLDRGITNLLVAGGAGSDGRPLQLAPGDLADEVRDAVAQLQPSCVAAGVTIDLERLDSAQVRRDRGAMRIVLHNLIDNAVKYSQDGDRVTVALENTGETARLRVCDAGCGMSREELDHAFDAFYRGQGKDWVGGAGLGLHLVRELMQAQGGVVEVQSEGRGHGCAFTVSMPIRGRAS